MTEPILGPARVRLSDAQSWAQRKGATSTFVSIAEHYWGLVEARGGVRPEVAYAQSAKETNYGRFGGVIDESYRNPCGLKTAKGGGNYDPAAHQRFASWPTGVMAHLDHLALYAGHPDYPRIDTPDPRHFPFIHGKAPTVEALGGAWAPSKTYGTEIVRLMHEFSRKEPTPVPPKLWTPRVFTRADWNARPPKSAPKKMPGPFRGYVQHYSTGEELGRDDCAEWWREIQRYHQDVRGWADIGYNFGGCRHGDVFVGRGWDVWGAHTGDWNPTFHGVCYLGDDDPAVDDATPEGRRALRWVRDQLLLRHPEATALKGHRDQKATSCPGDELYAWIKAGMPLPDDVTEGGDNMQLVYVRHPKTGDIFQVVGNTRVKVSSADRWEVLAAYGASFVDVPEQSRFWSFFPVAE